MLNVRFIVKMLGVMFILETFFMLAATVVAFLYRGSDVYPVSYTHLTLPTNREV